MIPNYNINPERCTLIQDEEWVAKADWGSEVDVQQIIDRADELDYDAFFMNLSNEGFYDFG